MQKIVLINAFFVTEDDIIIGDPEGEYYPLDHALGGQVIQDQVWNRVTINRGAHKSTRYYIDGFHAPIAYTTENGVHVIPVGCLKD